MTLTELLEKQKSRIDEEISVEGACGSEVCSVKVVGVEELLSSSQSELLGFIKKWAEENRQTSVLGKFDSRTKKIGYNQALADLKNLLNDETN